jgi:hypothetical protein
MTRRERLENKLAKREEWAAKRRSAAGAVFQAHEKYRGDHAFNTQPGHIPERARVIRREEKAFESLQVADHHDSCAKGIANALDNSIFSDDGDAVEALEARIAEREAERTRKRNANRLYRKGDAEGLKALGLDLESLRMNIAKLESWQDQQPYAKYELANLGGRISADKKRLEAIKARQARSAKAEAAPNGVILETFGDYVTVTFAEKPESEILHALRGAGFSWGAGYWGGKAASLPAEVRALIATNDPQPIVTNEQGGGQ